MEARNGEGGAFRSAQASIATRSRAARYPYGGVQARILKAPSRTVAEVVRVDGDDPPVVAPLVEGLKIRKAEPQPATNKIDRGRLIEKVPVRRCGDDRYRPPGLKQTEA